jgi:hypothetical protein
MESLGMLALTGLGLLASVLVSIGIWKFGRPSDRPKR